MTKKTRAPFQGARPSTKSFGAQVPHELNNILASISLSAQLLLRQAPEKLTAAEKKSLENIIADTKKMAALIKRLDEQSN